MSAMLELFQGPSPEGG